MPGLADALDNAGAVGDDGQRRPARRDRLLAVLFQGEGDGPVVRLPGR